jgi:hypothetical protein
LAIAMDALWSCSGDQVALKKLRMKIIEIRPSKKFDGSWSAYEGPGVSLCYPGPQSKQFAIDCARKTRFGCTSGEIHVYDDTGETVTNYRVG